MMAAEDRLLGFLSPAASLDRPTCLLRNLKNQIYSKYVGRCSGLVGCQIPCLGRSAGRRSSVERAICILHPPIAICNESSLLFVFSVFVAKGALYASLRELRMVLSSRS